MANSEAFELRLPHLPVGEKEIPCRSSITWNVYPGAKVQKGQLLGRVRAYHEDLNVRWIASTDDCQVLLYAPVDGTVVSLPQDDGGWNSLGAVMEWEPNRDTGAILQPAEGHEAPADRIPECSIIYADRCHPTLEPRNGGVLVPGSSRRIELWSGAPARPQTQLLAYGVCDLTALFGGVSGDYESWTQHLSGPCLTTFHYDVLISYSSYFLLQDLDFSDASREEVCAEVVDLMQEYMTTTKDKASSVSLMFLTLLLDQIQKTIIKKDLEGPKMRAATPVDGANQYVFLGLNADAPIHLKSKKSGFLFAAHLWRFRAFDKAFTRLLRKRFIWMEPNAKETLANVETLTERIGAAGHNLVVGTMEIPKRRTFDFSKKPIDGNADYWWRETNLGVRKIAQRTNLKVVDLDRVITSVGSSLTQANDPADHHDDRIMNAQRQEFASVINPPAD